MRAEVTTSYHRTGRTMEFTYHKMLSSRLSRHLDHFKSVGPTETVNIRRLFVYLNADTYPQQEFVSVPTGSKAEGFDFSTSDTDVMLVHQNAIVIQEHEEIPGGNKTVFAMDRSDCRPGFTLLKLRHLTEANQFIDALIHMEGSRYLSSVVYMCNMLQPGDRLHGPCSTKVCPCSKEYDRAFSFHCASWPDDIVSNFRSRTRYCLWPSRRLVDRIVTYGCHFVAIGDKQSDLFGMQWRISFAKAEKCLVMTFNQTQFKTYALLKIFLTQVFERDSSVKDLLCSYFMKTIVFYAIEHSKSSMWVDENLLNCFRFCFNMLLEFVKTGYCPNYFVPTNNMFLAKVVGDDRRKLVLTLNRYEWMGFMMPFLCPSLDFTGLRCPSGVEHDHTIEDHLDSYIQSTCHYYMSYDIVKIVRNVGKVDSVSTNESHLNFTMLCFINTLVYVSVLRINAHTNDCINKHKYKSIRKHRRLVEISSVAMVCRGHLTLATFHYNSGCFIKACQAAERVVSLCYRRYEDRLGKGYSHLQKAQKYYFCDHLISDSQNLYLQELDLEVMHRQTADLCLPPLPYALFLLVLSSYKLCQTYIARAYMAELLQLRTDERFGETKYPIILNLIGICHQHLGDTTLAIKALQESCKRFPENTAAAVRISNYCENLSKRLGVPDTIEELDYCNVTLSTSELCKKCGLKRYYI